MRWKPLKGSAALQVWASNLAQASLFGSEVGGEGNSPALARKRGFDPVLRVIDWMWHKSL